MNRTFFSLALLATGLSGPAFAQASGQPAAPAPVGIRDSNSLATADIDTSIANGPNDRSLKAGAIPDLQVSISEDEKIGSFAWGWTLSAPSGNGGNFSFTNITFKFSTQLEKGAESTALLGLKGFRGGTTLALNFTRFWGTSFPITPPIVGADNQALARAQANCNEQFKNATEDERSANCDEKGEKFSFSTFIEKYSPSDLQQLVTRHFAPAYPFIGVEFAGNQDDFDYFDRSAFALDSVRKFSFSGTVFGGVLFTHTPASLGASFTYARRHDAASSITLCQPINAVPQSQCLTGADGLPSRSESAIFSVEGRRAFSLKLGAAPSFAVSIEASADVLKRAFSINAPIYIVGDGEGKLRGGIRFGYTNGRGSDGKIKSDFGAGLFIGVPFKLTN